MKTRLLYTLTAVLLFLMPNVNFGQAPNLGTAANYVLFTTLGAVTNTGISHLTGNVGTNNGAVTGFGNVNGVMSYTADAKSAQCATDLLLAYNQLSSTIPAYFPSNLLGNGDTLIAGVYSITGATTLNLNLTLNAQGNPNAVFIFKIQGTLSTGANSKVKLINGAKACNVFWKVEGLVSMASGTSMKGTVIANNAAINMNTGDTLEGRALSIAGAVSVNGVMGYTPVGCGSPVLTGPALPMLSSAACYTIFSSNGSVTNAGVTFITGDVGTNVGLTTGFQALNVTGAIHPIPDGSTAAAAADLLNAYTFADAIPYDIELLYPAQFGRNLVLTPHTYLMNGAVTFTDTLYLNAMGDANATFVIKVYGALSTSTYSKVLLINGTQAKNVYWMVSGAVSINDYSIFNGTIICNNGAMSLNTGVVLNGRALTTTGIISTAAITAIMPPGCSSTSAPVIITEPTNKMVCVGDSVIFTVSATGTGLTYQWRKGNVNLTNGGNIYGATSAFLKIKPVGISDAALNYNVIVNGSLTPSATSVNVSLTVNTAPIITTEPVNQTLCAGNSVSFSVISSGSGLTYQWRKGTVNLTNVGNITGATSATLTINPVNITNAALNYNVIVSGTCSPNATSNNATLTVNTAPIITTEPVNQTACAGNSVSFSVISSGSGLTYQWRKGTVNLTNVGNITGATTATLTINPVNVTNAALNYNVIVSGTCSPNATSNNASLTVNTAPIITTEPANQTACAGSSISFSVIAIGSLLTYQWRKGTVNLINGTNISGANTNTLTIISANITDVSSNYNVVVSGDCTPNDTSINVALVVNTSTAIITEPINQTACLGSPVSFTVIASGPGLTYQWRKGIVNLTNGGNISGANSATLTINPVNFTDIASNYNVVVSGGCSPINSSAVNLNSAGRFGILAAVGISTTGFSEIHDMDVGISPGVRSSVTGFPPAIVVNGAIYASDDIAPPGVAAMLIQAKQDLTNAYLFAEGASAPAPVTVAGDQGGITLAPGIYKSTSTLLIQSGDLTLDGQGDANATWIFQIASDFTTVGGAGGNVILSGNAQAKNVTWQVGSSATIGNSTSFKGNILALTSITMNTGSSIEGRLLARNGAIVLSGTNIINNPLTSAVNLSLATSVNVSLTVNTAPVITTGPANQTVCNGNSVSFSVISTGTGLTYQWRKGTVNLTNTGTITGATSPTLTINPVSTTDAALNYNVVIIGACAPNNMSNNASLTVNSAPNITAQPISQTGCAGSSVSFTVVSSGTGLTYQWRKGTVNLANAGTVSGVNTATLSIYPANLADAASNYNVIVSGTCAPNQTSTNVSLAINAGPVISTQPANQTVCAGFTASFSIIATGAGLTYQWRKGTVNLNNGLTYSGVTTATLTISSVSIADAASNYNVVVSGACAPNGTSNNASLTVNSAPNIAAQPINQTGCAGSSVSFTITATGTGLTYQWRNGLVNLTNGGSVSGATSSTLTINPVVLSDSSSDYNVVVKGTCIPDVITVYASLIVYTAPDITIQPANQTSSTGELASFTVTATGTGLTYQWRRGTTNLTNGGNISGVTTKTLTINPVTPYDTVAYYNVVVSGACLPDVTSNNVTLDIIQTGFASFDFGKTNNAVAIYPNPFTTSLTIVINDVSQIGSFDLKILNVLGVEMMSSYITKQTTTLQTSSLPTGIYFYRVIDHGKVIQSGKLISQH
ncbi:MAG: ice-binding family protein [Bacteroidales bacterium]|nr:ice-binding family protein [Bacteroidales bacterium]